MRCRRALRETASKFGRLRDLGGHFAITECLHALLVGAMAQASGGGDMLGFLLGLQPMSGAVEATAAAPAGPFLDDSAGAQAGGAFRRGGVPAAHAWLPEEYDWNPTTLVRAPAPRWERAARCMRAAAGEREGRVTACCRATAALRSRPCALTAAAGASADALRRATGGPPSRSLPARWFSSTAKQSA
jgi:hypothetical protein